MKFELELNVLILVRRFCFAKALGVSEGTTLPQRTTTTDYYYYRRLLVAGEAGVAPFGVLRGFTAVKPSSHN